MANEEHLKILRQGAETWNRWRKENPAIRPDLTKADLEDANLQSADLSQADLKDAFLLQTNLGRATLSKADLKRAYLSGTDLTYADLSDANLTQCNLFSADLTGANLVRANLTAANLYSAILSGVNLTDANLRFARLVRTRLDNAIIVNCSIHGISAWALELEGAVQSNLAVNELSEPTLAVDDLEVAQFIYLLVENQKIRDAIDTISRKVVLILGRFTPERMTVLDAIKVALRQHGYLPVLFDFDGPASRNLTETISTLAHMARFVIADITDAKSIPQELQRIVPALPSVPVQPLLHSSDDAYGMFGDFMDYPWVLKPYRYDSTDTLVRTVEERIVVPVMLKAEEIRERRKRIKQALELELMKGDGG